VLARVLVLVLVLEGRLARWHAGSLARLSLDAYAPPRQGVRTTSKEECSDAMRLTVSLHARGGQGHGARCLVPKAIR
jgi:hypothetical protein